MLVVLKSTFGGKLGIFKSTRLKISLFKAGDSVVVDILTVVVVLVFSASSS